jgi:hypothetical protein
MCRQFANLPQQRLRIFDPSRLGHISLFGGSIAELIEKSIERPLERVVLAVLPHMLRQLGNPVSQLCAGHFTRTGRERRHPRSLDHSLQRLEPTAAFGAPRSGPWGLDGALNPKMELEEMAGAVPVHFLL